LAGGIGETAPTEEINYADIAFGEASASGGYDMFKDPELIDVNLIIGGPEYQNSSPSGTTVAKLIKDRITDVRKDCVLFCSAPISNPALTETQKKDIAIAYRNNIGSSSYVVIDSGYKYMYDIYNDKYRWVPLCGDIAGLCARTDVTNDPWWSPAGFNRGQVKGVVKLAFNPTLTFRDELYKNNINPVVTFPGEGTVLYGDKTAQAKPSAFDRINVRRLFIVLEKAIATASKYSLFEFNDAFTRAQFRSLVEPFLRDVQSRRGLYDFKVVCDEKNNTPEVIDGNRFVADIYIKPARSINFIQLNFIATRTGVSFSEVGA
jgi:phage tail sheath protein FI